MLATAAPLGKSIHIVSRANKRFLTSNGGRYPMTFDRESPSGWEYWEIRDAGGYRVNFVQHIDTRTLFASQKLEIHGDGPMYSNRRWAMSWEQFKWEPRQGGFFSIKCHNSRWARVAANGQLFCNGTGGGEDQEEQFYYLVGMQGVWAAGVIQWPYDAIYGDKHRWYKIR